MVNRLYFIINDIHSVIIITTFMHAIDIDIDIDIVRYYIYDQESMQVHCY